MARSYEDITEAQNNLNNQNLDNSTVTLPPGYVKGFRFTINNDEKLTIGEGIVDVRGVRVDTSEYVVNFEDYTQPGYVINNLNYYIYLNRYGNWLIDSLPASFDTEFFGYYHPILTQYRYIGTFKLSSDGKYTKAVSEDPLRAGGVSTGFLSSLFLNTDETIIIGYSATSGINSLPEGGDRRIYIDEDEIGLEEYTGGEWSTLSGIKIGGAVAGLFLGMVGCRGIYHPENQPTSMEPIPTENSRVFDFEGDYEDQLGVDDWDQKGPNNTLSTDKYKFGTKSLFATSGNEGFVVMQDTWTVGSSQSAGVWIYMSSAVASNDFIDVFDFHTLGYVDAMRARVFRDHVVFDITRNGGDTLAETITINLLDNSWHYIGMSYDATNDLLYGSVDNNKVTVTPSDSWSSTTHRFFYLSVGNPSNDVVLYADDLLLAVDEYIKIDFFIQHYNHNIEWSPSIGYNTNDILLQPNTNGKVYTNGDVTVAQDLTTDKLKINTCHFSISDDYTVLTDNIYQVITFAASGPAADKTITLPAISGNEGMRIFVINLNATYKVTLDGDGAETINGSTTFDIIAGVDKEIEIIASTDEWKIIHDKPVTNIKVSLETNQTSNAGTAHKVNYDGVEWDILDEWDDTTNYRFTPKEAGKYLCIMSMELDHTPTDRVSYLYKNGATYNDMRNRSGGSSTGYVYSWSVDLSVGDYVEFYLYHNGGGNTTLTGSNPSRKRWCAIIRERD